MFFLPVLAENGEICVYLTGFVRREGEGFIWGEMTRFRIFGRMLAVAALLAGAGFMQTSLAAGAHDRLHYQAAGADILAEREVFMPGVAPLPMTLQAEEGGACGMIAAFPASESGKTLTNPQWQIRRGGGAFEDIAGADNCALRLPDDAADGGDAYIRIRFDEKAGRAIVGVRYGPATALSDLFGERLAKGDSDSSAVVSTISKSDSAQQLTLQNDSAVSDSADTDSPPPVLELEKAEEVVADSVAADSAVSDSDSSSAKTSTLSADIRFAFSGFGIGERGGSCGTGRNC